MKRAGPDFCWLGLGILLVLLFLAVSGPVMRECDQAALLEGAVEIARTGNFDDQGWYNYDKQFLSYWILAAAIDFTGLDAPGSDPAEVVALGNRTAAVFFSVALLLAFGFAPRRGMAFLPVAMAAFLAPALVFSVPLLASNIFSAGCLLLLAVTMRRRHGGWINAFLCALFAAAAIGFRRDAALVLPLLCLLSATRFTIGGILRERRHWLMAAASIGVAVFGTSMAHGDPYVPDMFFDARLFAAYLAFGLAGAAVVLFWLPFRLVTSRRQWLMRSATAAAMLLPFAFYLPYLYTPRHFVLSALVLLLVLILPRGELWWQVLRRRRLDRFVLWSSVLACLALWVIGFRFEKIAKPEVVFEDPTLYPTADGFWPMGCNRKFLVALSQAGQQPVDHNQEMWEAWTRVEENQLPPGEARVLSAGLRAYGYLALKIKGRDYAIGRQTGDFDLLPDRSIGRVRPGFYRSDGQVRAGINWEKSWLKPVGGNEWRQVYLVEERGDRTASLDLPWVAQLATVKAIGPDDFHLKRNGPLSGWLGVAGRGYRLSCLFAEQGVAARFRDALQGASWTAELHSVEAAGVPVHAVTFISRGMLPAEANQTVGEARWITRSLLPAFMSRSNY